MTFVKICGITREDDLAVAVDAGADALGLNFYPPSPRALSIERGAELANLIPAPVWKVGLFVEESAKTVLETADRVGLDTIQLLFKAPGEREDEIVRTVKSAGYRVLLTRRLDEQSDLKLLARLHTTIDHLLLDVLRTDGFGGTGHEIAESVLERLEQSSILASSFLAGGLTPENIGAKVMRFAPFGVDVASGVESAPGVKAAEKVRKFIAEAKQKSRSSI